jgi:hypothetical protein
MTPRLPPVPVLQGLTAASLAVAVACLAWPVNTAPAPQAPVLPPVMAVAPQPFPDDSALAERIVNANMFSIAREAPDARAMLASGGAPGTDDAAAATVAVSPMDASAPGMNDPVPALYGIIEAPGGMRALLRLDPSSRAAHLYRVGEGNGETRVRSIAPDRVTLDLPTGSRVLWISPRTGTP